MRILQTNGTFILEPYTDKEHDLLSELAQRRSSVAVSKADCFLRSSQPDQDRNPPKDPLEG
jgi:hypothetical protein